MGFTNKPPMRYDVMMVDPPWPKKKGGLRRVRPNQNRDFGYQTLSQPDIWGILSKLFESLQPSPTVFLWTIDQFLHDTEQGMKELGFKLHARIIWNKLNGTAPAFTIRFSHEYLLWFYKTPMRPIADSMRGKFLTVLEEKRREHSRKPECSYKMIEQLYPVAKRLDVFSREKRKGWDQFGDQKDYFN